MQVREIKELIQAVTDSDIVEFILEDESSGLRLSLRKDKALQTESQQVSTEAAVPQAVSTVPAAVPDTGESESEIDAAFSDDARYVTINAPMVGTFYRAPAPDADA